MFCTVLCNTTRDGDDVMSLKQMLCQYIFVDWTLRIFITLAVTCLVRCSNNIWFSHQTNIYLYNLNALQLEVFDDLMHATNGYWPKKLYV